MTGTQPPAIIEMKQKSSQYKQTCAVVLPSNFIRINCKHLNSSELKKPTYFSGELSSGEESPNFFKPVCGFTKKSSTWF